MANKIIQFFIEGIPKSQPRPFITKKGHAFTPHSADVWKFLITYQAKAYAKGKCYESPIKISIEYNFPKPIKPKSDYHIVKPDIDNLDKAVLDALKTARVYKDDCQVFSLTSSKKYAIFKPGCLIKIEIIGE